VANEAFFPLGEGEKKERFQRAKDGGDAFSEKIICG
jgi:hypothetical protein